MDNGKGIDLTIDPKATRIIVAGGRDFDDYGRMAKILDTFLGNIEKLVIVSGDCQTGADALAKKYAELMAIDHVEFKADWDSRGNAAGPIRNAKMAQYGHALIAFWDMQSKGTDNMIKQARKAGIPIMIIVY